MDEDEVDIEEVDTDETETEEEIAEREREEKRQQLESDQNNYNNAIEAYTAELNSSCAQKEEWEKFRNDIQDVINKLNNSKSNGAEVKGQLIEAYNSLVAQKKCEELTGIENQIQDIINKLQDPILISIDNKINSLNNDINRWQSEISSAQSVLSEINNEIDTL